MPRTMSGFHNKTPGRPKDKDRPIETEAERFTRLELETLAARYEAIRGTPGRDRDRAARDFGLALERYGAVLRCGDWLYQWSRAQESITRYPAEQGGNARRAAVMTGHETE